MTHIALYPYKETRISVLFYLLCVQVCLVLEGDRSTWPLPLLLAYRSGDIP